LLRTTVELHVQSELTFADVLVVNIEHVLGALLLVFIVGGDANLLTCHQA
jgi:hypothetical protein